VVWWCA